MHTESANFVDGKKGSDGGWWRSVFDRVWQNRERERRRRMPKRPALALAHKRSRFVYV